MSIREVTWDGNPYSPYTVTRLVETSVGNSPDGLGVVTIDIPPTDTEAGYVMDMDVNSMYPQIVIPTLRGVYPNLIAEDIVGVQPIPAGSWPDMTWYKSYKFDDGIITPIVIDHFEDCKEFFEI